MLYLHNYAIGERGYKKGRAHPPKIDVTRKKKVCEITTKMLKAPLNELWLIWPLKFLLNP